ncbi:MAG: hypothetical protein FWB92_11215 [Oscillospiraceae bacterium]|nr:hypothetical protein [Oscillospiraceae bacterium]
MNIIDGKNFLSGVELSSGKVFSLKNKLNSKRYRKDRYLVEKVKGKKVIHIGCCNHLELIDENIENGTWLHGNLCRSAAKVVGIDINSQAVDYVSSLGYSDTHCIDITAPPPRG